MSSTESWPVPKVAPDIPIRKTTKGGWKMKKDGSGAAYLIKLVHVIGQQIDNLACSGLTQGHVTKAKCLE